MERHGLRGWLAQHGAAGANVDQARKAPDQKGQIVKIAVATDDGLSMSTHFGRARAYLVMTVEDGKVVEREIRPKAAPHLEAASRPDDGGSHDGPEAHARHDQMIAPITDCAYVVARGMGRGAYDRITAVGIQAVVTDIIDPDEAAIACAEGLIVNLVGRLH